MIKILIIKTVKYFWTHMKDAKKRAQRHQDTKIFIRLCVWGHHEIACSNATIKADLERFMDFSSL